MGKRPVGVRVVGLEQDLIDTDVVALLQPDQVVEDAAEDPALGDLARAAVPSPPTPPRPSLKTESIRSSWNGIQPTWLSA